MKKRFKLQKRKKNCVSKLHKKPNLKFKNINFKKKKSTYKKKVWRYF